MNDQIATIFIVFLYVLIAAIIVRSLLSWFPNIDRRNQLVQMLDMVTEPLLTPVRNIMPRTGMIDLSAMVVIILLIVMVNVVQSVSAQ